MTVEWPQPNGGRTSLTTYIMTSALRTVIPVSGAWAPALQTLRCSKDCQRSKLLTRVGSSASAVIARVQASRGLASAADEVLGHAPVPVTGIDFEVTGDDHHGHPFFL